MKRLVVEMLESQLRTIKVQAMMRGIFMQEYWKFSGKR